MTKWSSARKRWAVRKVSFANDFGHWGHLKAFSPLWVLRCFFRLPAWLNDFSHTSSYAHLWTFSPLCVKWCRLSFQACPKALLHSAHLCGFSPVWIRRWILRDPALPKDLSHWAHLWTFSLLWIERWLLRESVWPNDLLHLDSSPLWLERWVIRWSAWPKDLSHWAHLCKFSPEWDNKCLVRMLAFENDSRHIVQEWCLLAILIFPKFSDFFWAVVDNDWILFTLIFFVFSLTLWSLSLSGRSYLFLSPLFWHHMEPLGGRWWTAFLTILKNCAFGSAGLP